MINEATNPPNDVAPDEKVLFMQQIKCKLTS